MLLQQENGSIHQQPLPDINLFDAEKISNIYRQIAYPNAKAKTAIKNEKSIPAFICTCFLVHPFL
jgi:hypothetical protein